MLTLRLPAEMESRLEALAKTTGRAKSFYAKEAIIEYLDDLEDWYRAAKVLEDIRSGREETVPFEDIKREYGLLDD